ncbi:MAG: hypothetical protein Q9174_001711, partial [Haloplaca sp. 1 TL-2023]
PNPKYAHQGLSLLQTSLNENPADDDTPLFTRQLYIHALIYLLQGLPSATLSDAEIAGLRDALPSVLLRAENPEPESAHKNEQENKSKLRSFLATTSYILITILAFLTPCISLLVSKLGYWIRYYDLLTKALNVLGFVGRGIVNVIMGAVDPAWEGNGEGDGEANVEGDGEENVEEGSGMSNGGYGAEKRGETKT